MTKRTRSALKFIGLVLAAALAMTVAKIMHPASAVKPQVSLRATPPIGPATTRMANSIHPGMTQDQVRSLYGKPPLTNVEMNALSRRLLMRAGKKPSAAPPDPSRTGWFYKTSDGGTVGVGFHNGIVTLVTAAP